MMHWRDAKGHCGSENLAHCCLRCLIVKKTLSPCPLNVPCEILISFFFTYPLFCVSYNLCNHKKHMARFMGAVIKPVQRNST
ncbi:uncharacterized protein BDW47DRAFT_109480 [Aspergillus candidus]|uniref:Uncharacterized protein n=1 Tax=Aspergillus candidus TaxID=41067 RepID=A0A2I2F5N4_ASPCN|nr:hypothetical protein BDW47DRAFT_109480 [Aspergillus candidus]PLB35923.1 hypothetical protein BDW47DRAFT_109480 [Aspergillus candidus]